MHGKGKMTEENGASYEGEFKNNKMEGQGVKTYANGSSYTGKFKNSLQHGIGEFFSSKTGETTKQEFREGKKWTWTKNTDKEQATNPILHFKTEQ